MCTVLLNTINDLPDSNYIRLNREFIKSVIFKVRLHIIALIVVFFMHLVPVLSQVNPSLIKNVTNYTKKVNFISVKLSGNGKVLAFTQSHNGSVSLFTIDVDSALAGMVFPREQIRRPSDTVIAVCDISFNGTKILYFDKRVNSYGLYLLDTKINTHVLIDPIDPMGNKFNNGLGLLSLYSGANEYGLSGDGKYIFTVSRSKWFVTGFDVNNYPIYRDNPDGKLALWKIPTGGTLQEQGLQTKLWNKPENEIDFSSMVRSDMDGTRVVYFVKAFSGFPNFISISTGPSGQTSRLETSFDISSDAIFFSENPQKVAYKTSNNQIIVRDVYNVNADTFQIPYKYSVPLSLRGLSDNAERILIFTTREFEFEDYGFADSWAIYNFKTKKFTDILRKTPIAAIYSPATMLSSMTESGKLVSFAAYDSNNVPQIYLYLHNPDPVVNTTDDKDDGVCDDKHCSLREAINLVNSNAELESIEFNIPGTTTPEIMIEKQLPDLKANVTIDGSTQPTSHQVIIDGTNAGTGTNGISIVNGLVTLKNLSICKFKGNGISNTSNNEIIIIGGKFYDNTGFGIKSDKSVSIINLVLDSTIIAKNTKGGIFSSSGQLEASNLLVLENGGPGIAVYADIFINYGNISRNKGCGVYSHIGNISFFKKFNHFYCIVSSNKGTGIFSRSGFLQTHCPMMIDSNSSWGIFAQTSIEINNTNGIRFSTDKSRVNNNGSGNQYYEIEDWGDFSSEFKNNLINKKSNIAMGGGMYAIKSGITLSNTEINNNKGPGIVGWKSIWLLGANVINSEGPGVCCMDGIVELNDWSDDSPCNISGNYGDGIYARKWVLSKCGVLVKNNYGWGIKSYGTVNINDDDGGVVWQKGVMSIIDSNGNSGFYLEIPDYDPSNVFMPPIEKVIKDTGFALSGGILSFNLGVTGSLVSICNNNGPGIVAYKGIIINQGVINNNNGPGLHCEEGDIFFYANNKLFMSEVSFNNGYGFFNTRGKGVNIDGSLIISGNKAWGIGSKSNVSINLSDKLVPKNYLHPVIIELNGFSSSHYDLVWDENRIYKVLVNSKPQNMGGVWVNNGNFSGYNVEIFKNDGYGIIAKKDVYLFNSKVNANKTGILSANKIFLKSCEIKNNEAWGIISSSSDINSTLFLKNKLGAINISDTFNFPEEYELLAVFERGVNQNSTIQYSSLDNNSSGIEFYSSGNNKLNVNYCNIMNHSVIGIKNLSNVNIDASNNWWGSASGPGEVASGSGDKISKNVLYNNFLDKPVKLVISFSNDTMFLPLQQADSTFIFYRNFIGSSPFNLQLTGDTNILHSPLKINLVASDTTWNSQVFLIKLPDSAKAGDEFTLVAIATDLIDSNIKFSDTLFIRTYHQKIYSLLLNTDSLIIRKGFSFHFKAIIIDSTGNQLDLKLKWEASGGTIDSNGWYLAGDTIGNYFVKCRAESLESFAHIEIIKDVFNSINEEEYYKPITKSEFRIKPIPANYYLALPEELSHEKTIIYNSMGMEVLESLGSPTINVSHLPPGIYIIRIGKEIEKFYIVR